MSGLTKFIQAGVVIESIKKFYANSHYMFYFLTVFVFCKSINIFPLALHVMDWEIYMYIFIQASCLFLFQII